MEGRIYSRRDVLFAPIAGAIGAMIGHGINAAKAGNESNSIDTKIYKLKRHFTPIDTKPTRYTSANNQSIMDKPSPEAISQQQKTVEEITELKDKKDQLTEQFDDSATSMIQAGEVAIFVKLIHEGIGTLEENPNQQ